MRNGESNPLLPVSTSACCDKGNCDDIADDGVFT
jgi:hypothetical protein